MDEGLSHLEWMECFRSKIPSMKQEDFKKAWTHSNLRMNAQYSWETLHTRLEQAPSSAQNIPAIFFSMLASEDPSLSFLFYQRPCIQYLNYVGMKDVFSIQHWFDLCNMKRQQSTRISDAEFFSVCQNCEIDPNTICSFDHMKSVLNQIPEGDQTEWIKDLLDSDPPKYALTASLPQLREFGFDMIHLNFNHFQ